MKTQLDLAAVEAMCKDDIMEDVFYTYSRGGNLWDMLNKHAEEHVILFNDDPPDWVIAGLNCPTRRNANILPVCIHTYLMDWEAKK